MQEELEELLLHEDEELDRLELLEILLLEELELLFELLEDELEDPAAEYSSAPMSHVPERATPSMSYITGSKLGTFPVSHVGVLYKEPLTVLYESYILVPVPSSKCHIPTRLLLYGETVLSAYNPLPLL